MTVIVTFLISVHLLQNIVQRMLENLNKIEILQNNQTISKKHYKL